MKYTQILILAIFFISCKNESPNGFNLDVKLNGNYSGYLYLNYNEIKDSSLVKDGKVKFTGRVSGPTLASYSTNNISASDKNFYLENEKINSEVTFSKKQIGQHNIDWFTIDDISGTRTSIIEKDFEEFKLKFHSDTNWKQKLYEKLQKIIQQNPKHRYAGDLLHEISNDTILSKEQIGELYNNLDIEFQDPFFIKKIKSIAFPEYKIKVGDSIYDFTLPNKDNKLISTTDFRGQLLFIDFWASWCKPCRAQFPELTTLNNDFKNKGVKILGVSIDEKLDDWVKALGTENPQWTNVHDIEGFSGKLADKYGIFAIPFNILIDQQGKVIANDLSPKDLRKVLDSLIMHK